MEVLIVLRSANRPCTKLTGRPLPDCIQLIFRGVGRASCPITSSRRWRDEADRINVWLSSPR
jgi:hypothetical protein